MIRRPPSSPLFPSPPLSRSAGRRRRTRGRARAVLRRLRPPGAHAREAAEREGVLGAVRRRVARLRAQDRKSTRLNSSHLVISYAVFCLKKKKQYAHAEHHHA